MEILCDTLTDTHPMNEAMRSKPEGKEEGNVFLFKWIAKLPLLLLLSII